MKFQILDVPDKRLSPLVTVKTAEACSDPGTSGKNAPTPQYITGYFKTDSGNIPQVSTSLSSLDKRETVKARISSFRMNYIVKPGLYAVGNPGQSSDVFVTANYKMSFDSVRSALNGMDAWILVLDTKGINVWCAAGKGTFGTDELLKRMNITKLPGLVSHRKLIVPQLGAPGIDSGEVKRKSGFVILYGPVRAEDIGEYLSNGRKCDEGMRRVRFDIMDRLILTPIELRQIFAKFHYFALFVFIFFGLTPQGIIFSDSFYKGYSFFAAGLLSIFAGAFFTPVFLPFIPFRAFALKGWIAGIAIFGSVFYLAGVFKTSNMFLVVAALTLFPLLSSYMALQFTGASTYTSLSGVKKELKFAFPVYILGGIVAFIFMILYKISDWGLI